MTVHELNQNQLDELKWQVYCDPEQYGEFDYFPDITNEHIYKFFGGIDFVPDDFTTEDENMKTYPAIYYETFATDGEKCSVCAFETLGEAIEHAEKSGCKTIQENGGSYAEYEKCEFCGEWCDTSEMNIENYCERCQVAIHDHGFMVDPRKKNDIY